MKKYASKIALVLMLVLLASSLGSPVASAKLPPGSHEHPRLVRAIKAIEGAIDYLQKAPHDFGGHRAEAVEACQNAIKQLKVAIQYDEKHD
jgi:hypothetical protein